MRWKVSKGMEAFTDQDFFKELIGAFWRKIGKGKARTKIRPTGCELSKLKNVFNFIAVKIVAILKLGNDGENSED